MATCLTDAPQSVDSIECHINHFFDQVVASVNHRRLTLIAEANEKRLEMTARVTLQAKKEEELMNVKSDIEHKIKTNQLRELQEQMLVGIEEKVAEMRLLHPETRLVFQGECEQLQQLILGIGKVVEEEVSAITRYHDMRKVVGVARKGQNPGELSEPNAIAIDELTNNIYVTEYAPARVSIFSESGKFLNTFTNRLMEHPYGIAIHSDNVYVTDLGIPGVFQFKIEMPDIHLHSVIAGNVSDDEKSYRPRQLTVSTDGEVFVADCSNHKIQILDASLFFKRSIKHDSMLCPIDVKLSGEQVYVLTLVSDSCVHVFSHDGVKLRSFITKSGVQGITGAWFFCLDTATNLIISDGEANLIKVFSPDGTLLHSIGGFQGGLPSPHGLALTKENKLVVVAPYCTSMLQIFSV